MDVIPSNSSLLLYQTEDGQTKIEVRLQDETVWLSQTQLCALFDKDKRTISEHIQNIFKEGELAPDSTVRKFRTVQMEGTREVARQIDFYNLDVIISVGYRVSSQRGTQFRIWATHRLKEYLIKGFTLDDERLKQNGGGNYFSELLARIRDIRSSEKVFWRKVLDIYATSIDYDPKTESSKQFFAVVQNKMHWAAHGHTAAEIIHSRANAEKAHMGLTSWSGKKPRQTDAEIAKNYLNAEELKVLNLIVSLYLDFAELQALSRNPMSMKDWIAKLDDFLRMTSRDILSHAGKISHEDALDKARIEYSKYQQQVLDAPSLVEQHFLETIRNFEKERCAFLPPTTQNTSESSSGLKKEENPTY
ncbi:MAG: virulence RhuM family protein [Verrucomicrobia bacterium]|nr:virulence RhuM family protein [Verrucomicrobiota bacterium]MBU6447071.1 virulence RhuM family protein [Verrucomicrobiota bacterium]MDE3047026.1 virulence RhuM family protein [Verrucomicrobiota bacterium]